MIVVNPNLKYRNSLLPYTKLLEWVRNYNFMDYPMWGIKPNFCIPGPDFITECTESYPTLTALEFTYSNKKEDVHHPDSRLMRYDGSHSPAQLFQEGDELLVVHTGLIHKHSGIKGWVMSKAYLYLGRYLPTNLNNECMIAHLARECGWNVFFSKTVLDLWEYSTTSLPSFTVKTLSGSLIHPSGIIQIEQE